MFERTSVRALPLVNRAADAVPVATSCCNACRTCLTTNVVGLGLAGAAAALAAVRRLARRE